MILAVDAGNSNIVLGCMEGLEIRHTLRLKTDRATSARRIYRHPSGRVGTGRLFCSWL